MGKKSTKLGVASLIAVGAGIAAVAAKSVANIQRTVKVFTIQTVIMKHLQGLKNLKVLITRVHIL